MRLIDAHALWVAISSYCNCRGDALLIIDKAPTIEAEPVRQGRWSEQAIRPKSRKVDEIGYYCSECGYFESYTAKYCAGCGAKMNDNKYI